MTQHLRVTLAGAETLKGKELKETLESRNFPVLDIHLVGAPEAKGQIEEAEGEATIIQPASDESFSHADFVFFAGAPELTQGFWREARRGGAEIIDLSHALDGEATLRAPWVEREIGREYTRELTVEPSTIAHPAAVILALVLTRLQSKIGVRAANVTVFEPASERGSEGLNELHQQAVKLLTFKSVEKEVFGVQTAFNLTPELGEHVEPKLEEIGERISRHFAALVCGSAPTPDILMLQAPVFHSHAFAIHLSFDAPTPLTAVEQALAGEHIQLVAAPEAPSNFAAAGSAEIHVQARAGASDQRSCWLWIAADNLCVAAQQAVETAEQLAALRPQGKVQ